MPNTVDPPQSWEWREANQMPNTHTFVAGGGSGGSGGINTTHWGTDGYTGTTTNMWPPQVQTVVVTTCIVCEVEVPESGVLMMSSFGLCELCRKAILMFRAKVLEEMAKDLLEMEDD